jgi:uncharacterized protein YhaN
MQKNPVTDYLYKQLQEQRTKLEKLLQRKERIEEEIRELKRRILAIQSTFNKALEDFKVDMSEYDSEVIKPIATMRPVQEEQKKRKTIADEAFVVLQNANRPLHIQELTRILLKERKIESQAKHPIASITSSLMRDEKRFESLGHGMWKVRQQTEKDITIKDLGSDV